MRYFGAASSYHGDSRPRSPVSMSGPMDKNSNPRLSQANITQATSAQARPAPVQAVQPPPQAAPDVVTLTRRVVAHWPVIIVTMVLGAVITFQVVRIRKPTYKSETVISYREGIGRTINGPNEGGDGVRSLGTKLKETLLAQQTLRKLIDEFHLYPDILQKAGYADAVDQMRKKTEFKSRSTDTFAIAFEGVDRDQAQRVCARMADLLVTENAKRLQEENKGTTEFLEAEKKRADEELERVEREMSEFLQAHPEFATATNAIGTESLAIKSKADEEEKKRNRPKPGRGPRQGSVTLATQGGGALSDRAAAAVDPLLLSQRTQAMSELGAAKKDQADKSLRFTEQHPDVRAANERVAAAEAALRHAEEAIAEAAPKEDAPRPRKVMPDDPYADPAAKAAAPVAASDPDSDDRNKPKPKPKAVDPDQGDKIVTMEMEWAKLGRAHALAKTHHGDLENKLSRAETAASAVEAGYGTSIVVLDPAFKPSGPSNAPNRTVLIIGLAASVAVGIVLSAAWGLFLDDRLFSASEVEGVVMVPVLGVVPRDKRRPKGRDPGAPGSPGSPATPAHKGSLARG